MNEYIRVQNYFTKQYIRISLYTNYSGHRYSVSVLCYSLLLTVYMDVKLVTKIED